MTNSEGAALSSEQEPTPATPTSPTAIRPIETVLAIGGFILLCANVWADWQSESYGGGIVSVALISFVLLILGKNAGSLIGGGK